MNAAINAIPHITTVKLPYEWAKHSHEKVSEAYESSSVSLKLLNSSSLQLLVPDYNQSAMQKDRFKPE